MGNLTIVNGLPPKVKKGEMVAMDIEMFGQEVSKLHRPHGTFACITICLERDGDTVYIVQDTKDLKKVFELVSSGLWVLHNARYDFKQLSRWVELKDRFVWDTMLVDQSQYGGYYSNFGLKDLARRYLGVVMDKETRENFEKMDSMTDEMIRYAADDASLTLKVAVAQRLTLEDGPGWKAYQTDQRMMFPLLEINGATVDVGAWEKAIASFQTIADNLQNELGFNVYSPVQVVKALKSQGLNLANTQAKTLAEYSDVPVVKQLMEARMYRKATSTYGTKWLENYVEADGKVYSSWNITGAETGRMSSSKPNGQNIPARKMPIYRTFFIPSPGGVMVVDDVSQQEPCILAYESKDPILTAAIKAGEDLHQAVADAIHMERAIGKAINLGIGYGLSAHGLSTRVGMTEAEAEAIITNYFSRFNGVFRWIQSQRDYGRKNGYVKTSSTGRRIYLNTHSRQWQNNAINAPIQGGAADFTKHWVRNYWEACHDMDIPYSLCMIVHDELVMDVPKQYLKKNREAIDRAFYQTSESLFPGIPFRFELEQGKSWACKQMSDEIWEDDDEGEDE